MGTTGALLVAVQAVIHQSGGDQRSLLTLNYGQANPIAEIPLNTEGAVSLAATQDRTVNVIAFEEEYQLAWVGANATALDPTDVAPLQVAPSALMVNQRGDMRNVLAYNAASPSVTALSVDYVFNKRTFNMKALADYRAEWMGVLNEILRRLLQRVKDCVCEHLLVDCPTCDETDRLILACVEIRAKQVYNICNFHRREVVTFPKLFYWLSAIPIIPLMTAAIERICCAALARPSASLNKEGTGIVSAKVLNQNAVRLQTVDFDQMQKALSSYLKMTSSFGGQALVRKLGGETKFEPGGTCGCARESNVCNREADAGAVRRERQSRHSLDSAFEGSLIERIGTVPIGLNPGDKVDLYTRNGKVVFYTQARAGIVQQERTVSGAADTTATLTRRVSDLEASHRDSLAQRDAQIAALKKDLDAVRALVQKSTPPAPEPTRRAASRKKSAK